MAEPLDKSKGISPIRVGRRIGSILFWVLVVFVSGSATLSIVTQVFPQLAREPLRTEARSRCGTQIPVLRDALLERARQIPSNDGEAGHKAWFAEWDASFHNLGPHCGELEPTRVELRRLRDSIQALLMRFERRETPRLQRIQRGLDEMAAPARAPSAS